jgi:hypothetical protein
MPRKMIFAAWNEMFPDRKQRILQPRTPISHSFVEIQPICFDLGAFKVFESDDEALDRFCQPLAKHFIVSPIAMRIRLKKLGLLLRAVPDQRNLTNGWVLF